MFVNGQIGWKSSHNLLKKVFYASSGKISNSFIPEKKNEALLLKSGCENEKQRANHPSECWNALTPVGIQPQKLSLIVEWKVFGIC